MEDVKAIYRFFDEEYHADALVSGDVWVSTLETCRKYEDDRQGDIGEAKHTYNSGSSFGGSNDSDFVEIARRSGIGIGENSSNIEIVQCTKTTTIPDAYVLCTTLEYQPDNLSAVFGDYCVEITSPKLFCRLLSEKINEINAITQGVAGIVQYRERSYSGIENPPGPIGFVKPPDDYADQKEFRLLLLPESNVTIKPFLVSCPEIKHFCRRLS